MDELEESLTLDELYLLLNAQRDKEKMNQEFLAGLQGIDMRAQEAEARKKEIERKAQEKINPNFEQETLSALGITFA